MKITDIVLVVLGIISVIFSMVQVLDPSNPNTQTSAIGQEHVGKPNMSIPLLVSAGMIGVGGALIFFGGRGYYVSNNPQVRN